MMEHGRGVIPVLAVGKQAECKTLLDTAEQHHIALALIEPQHISTSDFLCNTRILWIGAGQAAQAAARCKQCDNLTFELLISDDAEVLKHPDILQRCADVLICPYSSNDLAAHITYLQEGNGIDQQALDILRLNIIGNSARMERMFHVLSSFAGCEAPVLLNGETGTGKELVARAIHYAGNRQDHAFIPVNCCALNDDLLLGELFGYEKGAFTDAKQAYTGLVAQADGGTLFLDEINSLSPKGQGALLRFLQDQEYRPLGSSQVHYSNVRVISAGNQDLAELVAQGKFREDLYYRLHILHLTIPPLRERRGDIELLTDHFLAQLSRQYRIRNKSLHPITRRWMDTYQWPGNVRELENYLHRIFVLSPGPSIYVAEPMGDPQNITAPPMHTDMVAQPRAAVLSFQEEKQRVMLRFEREYLHELLKATGGNISEAARRAGKERKAFSRLLKKHSLERSSYT